MQAIVLQVDSHYSNYKLLGFDVFIDSNCEPHMIGHGNVIFGHFYTIKFTEVNTMPNMNTGHAVDE